MSKLTSGKFPREVYVIYRTSHPRRSSCQSLPTKFPDENSNAVIPNTEIFYCVAISSPDNLQLGIKWKLASTVIVHFFHFLMFRSIYTVVLSDAEKA